MRHAAWFTKSAVAVAVLVLGLSAGLVPAEAKGAPHGKGGGGGAKNRDTTPPTIYAPSTGTVGTFLASGAVASFSVTVVDDKDPAPTYTVSPPSGSTFPVGTTTVTVTAKDAAGNTSTKSFGMTVTQVSLPKTYKVWWTDSSDDYGLVYFEWDITIGPDLTISGSGHQTALLFVDEWFRPWVIEGPSELSGEGSVSGTVASDGSFHLESSSNYWYTDGSVDESGNLLYAQATTGFSGSVTPSIDVNGFLSFPGGLPIGHYWSVQP